MKKWLLVPLIILVMVSSLSAQTVIKKGLIGQEDIYWGTGTFTRESSTGATLTLHKIPYTTPEQYGAKGDGVTDDTAAIQAAIDSLTTGKVILGPTTYLVTSTINIDTNRVGIIGAGQQATVINFVPTADDTLFYFYSGSELTQSFLRGVGIKSTDTTYTKVAIDLVDVSHFILDDVAVYPWNGDDLSVALRIRGRELINVSNVSLRADLSIQFSLNPDNAIDADHVNFHNCYLISDHGPIVTIDDNLDITNLSFDGYQAWIPTTYGVYWNDTTGTAASLNISFENVRIEQETLNTAYLFYIKHNYALYNLSFKNVYGGLAAKGYYLRKTANVTIENSWYMNGSNNEALNVDATVVDLQLINSFWQAGTTATLTGQYLVWGIPITTGPLPHSAIYSVTSTGGYYEQLLSTTTVSFAADGDTPLYTVPTGKRCVLTKAIIVAAANANSTDITIGQNGAETDFVGTTQMDNLDAQYDSVIIQPIMNATPVKGKSYAAGTQIDINVANQAGAAGNTVYLFGILY